MTSARTFESIVIIFNPNSTEERLGRVERPVLVARGSRDPIAARSWCQRLAAIAPEGRFLEIPGKPHVVQHGAPVRMAAGILAISRV
ncbi:alpha/beta fold hydrolase [Arthrobacter sp. 2MCAF14]|uniref:alpha/beta fold hydrolase n=1 Tax=Arthrobacter sp. 2MCAF14 TaxID=3232982 RepID=UPI003F8DA995